MLLLFRFKLVKTVASDIASDDAYTVCCVNNLLHSMFSSLSVSLKGKPVTLHEANYHYKAYHEKLLNCGPDASGTHLLSSFWFLDSPTSDGALKNKTGHATRLHYLGNSNNIDLFGRRHVTCSIPIKC